MNTSTLDDEARAAALKHVSNLLQRPDQLEKVEQYRKRAGRKKASVEAMLKTAVHSQLEGVKTGLSQLQSALEDLDAIKQSMDVVDELFVPVTPLKTKLSELRDESIKHSQYAAAMENLKHIFNVPETIDRTREFLAQDELLRAHKQLMDLENARDDLLAEMYKHQCGSQHEMNLLKAYFSDVERLFEELGQKVFYIIERNLDSMPHEPHKLVTALRIIQREERIDDFCLDRQKQVGFLPPGRPRKWRLKCFQTLEKFVHDRIEGNQLEEPSQNRQWLVKYLETCRQIASVDLKIVKTCGGAIFPPEYDIFSQYVRMYHGSIGHRVREIAVDVKEKNEFVQLLSWCLKTYWSNEFLLPIVGPNGVEKLKSDDPLLPAQTELLLTNRFLQLTENDLKEWLEKALDQEKADWYSKRAPPEKDGHGYFYTPLPQIIYQMIDDQVQLAREIGDDKVVKMLSVCVEQFVLFGNKFREIFLIFKDKHLEDRNLFQTSFTPSMVAVVNNCILAADFTDKLKRHLRHNENESTPSVTPRQAYQVERQKVMQRIDFLRELWVANSSSALMCLLEEVIMDLNVHLSEIMTKKWLTSSVAVETISVTLRDYHNDHQHLRPAVLSQFVMELQVRIFGEYVKAIETRRLIRLPATQAFHSYDERKLCADKFLSENDILVSAIEHIAGNTDTEILKDLLPAVFGVLELKDKSLLALEVSSFVQKFRDVTVDQLANLIQLREDTTKSDAKQIAEEILAQNKIRLKSITVSSPYRRLFVNDGANSH